MIARFVTRTFADGVKQGLSLDVAELTRPFSFGSNWRKIRIAMNFAYDNHGLTANPTVVKTAFGVCSGSLGFQHSGGVTTNWLGYILHETGGTWDGNTLTYTAGSGNPYFAYTAERGSYATKVITTVAATNLAAGGQVSVPTTYGTLQRRSPIILELTKAVGSVSTHSECITGATQPVINCSTYEFTQLAENIGAITPAVYGALTAGTTSAITTALESNGVYDTFNLSFGTGQLRMEIYELVVMRFN